MIYRIVIFFILIFSYANCNAQGFDIIKANNIDSLINLIPQNPIENDYYNTIKTSGPIDKKILGIFKKQIGWFYSTAIYHDTIVFWISNVYQYKKDFQVLIVDFYYKKDMLIKYKKYLAIHPDNKQKLIRQKIEAYFDKNRLICLRDTINDKFKFNDSEIIMILSMSDIELKTNIESIKIQNGCKDKFIPFEGGLKIRRTIYK
jgi:hypothetical protein